MHARRRALAAWIALLTLLAACGTAAQPSSSAPQASAPGPQSSSAPKRITAAIKGDPFTLSQAVNTAGAGSAGGGPELEQLVHVGLTTVDGDGRVLTRLAEAVPSIDNGLWKVFPDGRMETTWKIRSGAKWHDGTPVTSDDVLFTASLLQDPELVLGRIAGYAYVERLDAPDPQTVVLTWREPFIRADSLFVGAPPLP